MSDITNVYCDESCHLEHSDSDVMVLGAIFIDKSKMREVCDRIIEIKERNKVSKKLELKWTKVSKGNPQVYIDLIDYFFDDDDISFRSLIVPSKKNLSFDELNTYDDWYYKMYFTMLKWIISPDKKYNFYIDIKDTNSYAKATKLHNILCSNEYDFQHKRILKVQPIRSHEVEVMQLTDLLIGAISYVNRGLSDNETKLELVKLIQKKSTFALTKSTLIKEPKFNLFFWNSRENYYGM